MIQYLSSRGLIGMLFIITSISFVGAMEEKGGPEKREISRSPKLKRRSRRSEIRREEHRTSSLRRPLPYSLNPAGSCERPASRVLEWNQDEYASFSQRVEEQPAEEAASGDERNRSWQRALDRFTTGVLIAACLVVAAHQAYWSIEY